MTQKEALCTLPVKDWINTEEYREKNFKRKALVINPAKACQPIGAIMAASGFEKTLPFVHGSQGCVAYFRNNLSRHFREPVSAVSTSMTEDAAVFGGQANLIEGLRNSYALYKPEMIAICTSCIAEVIGDDLNAFINNARGEEAIPDSLLIPYANTPSFVGSHLNGYDNMIKAILSSLTKGREAGQKKERINIIQGFDANIGNIREIKRILGIFRIRYTILGDNEDVLDSPLTGSFKMYPGGTSLEDARESMNNKATIALQRYSTEETIKWISSHSSHEAVAIPMPIGITATDKLMMEISHISNMPIPKEIEDERGRAVDAMTDAHQYIHGKRFAIFGDPDIVIGVVSFLLEMGGEPVHLLCTSGRKRFEKDVESLLDSSPYGKNGKVYAGHDLWHLRSLLMTEPVDMLIGSSYGKFAARDANIPLVRIGFPIVDRVNLHRYPIIGYQGIINIITAIANTFLEWTDNGSDNEHFELLR